MRIMARSSSNRNSASARANSVLPTPVGPRKMKLPTGRFGSFNPERARTTASATAVDSLVLADHALVQLVLQVKQLLHLRLRAASKPERRSTG